MLFVALAALVVFLALLITLILIRRKFKLALLESETVSRGLRKDLAAETERLGVAKADKQATERLLEKTSTEVETLTSRLGTAQEKAAAAQKSEQEVVQRIMLLEVEAEHLRDQASDIEPRVLWELELQRSERTWRHSVSILPESDPSPFQQATDPLRLAVEVEAAALKEEAGAFLSVDWQAAPVEDPARAHLILRLAQEILSEAARSPIPTCLVVTGTGAVTLALVPSEDEDQKLEINLRTPKVEGQLIKIDNDHRAKVTVTYA